VPKRWGRLAAAIGGALAALLPGTFHPALRPAFAVAADAGPSAPDEAQFVADINQVRGGAGVAALHVDDRLVAEARRWAATMASSGVLHHNPDMAADAPPGWTMLGENVGTGGSVAAIEDAFVNSPHHYDNMVNGRFDALGVGVVVDGNVLWVAEEFMAGGGVPAPAPAAPPPAMPHRAPPPPPPPVSVVAALPAPVLQQVSSVLAQLRLLEGFGPGE
jgi:Cysteine-rich secretory protein family